MGKPYIYFCGDETKCDEIREMFKSRIKSVFITDKNSGRYLVSPKSHPFLICLIFSQDIYANDKTLEKLYKYAEYSGCPLHVDGSRKNLETVIRHAEGANIQRSSLNLMIKTINELCDYADSTPDCEFELIKSRFTNVVVITDSAASFAFCENKAASAVARTRTISVSGSCSRSEFELLKNISLSQVITDAPLNENSLELFRAASKEGAPAVLLDSKINYGKKVRAHYVDTSTEGDKIAETLTEYDNKKSKMLYLKNK